MFSVVSCFFLRSCSKAPKPLLPLHVGCCDGEEDNLRVPRKGSLAGVRLPAVHAPLSPYQTLAQFYLYLRRRIGPILRPLLLSPPHLDRRKRVRARHLALALSPHTPRTRNPPKPLRHRSAGEDGKLGKAVSLPIFVQSFLSVSRKQQLRYPSNCQTADCQYQFRHVEICHVSFDVSRI